MPTTERTLRVLVVDDDRDGADTLGLLIEELGNQVHVTYGGTQALNVASVFQPDLMLIDLAMPDMDGCRLVTSFRQMPAFAQTKFVAVTGFADQGHKTLALKAGFDTVLFKPAALLEIKAVLASVGQMASPVGQSPEPTKKRAQPGGAQGLLIREARRIRSERKSRTLTQAESEAAICEGFIRFREDYLGWRAKEIRVHIIKDLLEETGNMENASTSLQKKHEEATDEAQKLRQKLEKNEREALLDVLTGLHNRKAFGRTLQELYDTFKAKGTAFSLIMLDIDFFKKFNDTYGHKIGDEVLHIVGTTLKECIKGKDLAARYGGEEFVVLLPATTLANAHTLAEQIRLEVAGKTLKLKKTGEKIGNISCSLGISQIRGGDSMDAVVERADQALYLAKHSGRNDVKTERELAYTQDRADDVSDDPVQQSHDAPPCSEFGQASFPPIPR